MRIIIAGSTGLVGRALIDQLAKLPHIDQIVTIGRRPSGQSGAKVENLVPLCRRCHVTYDLNKTMESRMDFWIENGHIELAQRIRNLIEP